MSAWSRPLVGLVALALAVAACGGAASPAPTTGGSDAPATQAATTSQAPASSEGAPTAAPSTGSEGPDIGGAAAALAGLDSYHLRTVMKMHGLEDSIFSFFGDGMEMEGTIIFRPTRAADLSISMGAEAQKTTMGYRLIGDRAWVGLGDSWMESTAEDAQSTIDSFAPDKMLGAFAGVSGLQAVGEESKNGVETIHDTAPAEAVGASLGDTLGLTDATWSMDLWIAKDAGYAVGYAVLGKSASGSFETTLDITRINDPGNTVEEPANVGG